MKTLPASVALCIAFSFVAVAQAERPPEDRDGADYVVTGEVTGVFRRNQAHYYEYIVQIRIDAVEKGAGYAADETIYAFAFRRKPDAPAMPSPGGHQAVPKEGQRIRAYIKRNAGTMEAIYPDWYDVLK